MIELKVYGETAQNVLDELKRLTGGLGQNMAPDSDLSSTSQQTLQGEEGFVMPEVSAVSVDQHTPPRERGKPSPGKARRTKEEIAEDEAADAAEAATAEPAANISTGEDRIDPEAEKMDAADEAADEANVPAPTATRDDVRQAMMDFNDKHTIEKLQPAMAEILAAKWPDGSVTQLSKIPEDPEAFAYVIGELQARM